MNFQRKLIAVLLLGFLLLSGSFLDTDAGFIKSVKKAAKKVGKVVKKVVDKVTSNVVPCIPIPGRHCGPDGIKVLAWAIPDKFQCGTVLVSFRNACKHHDDCYRESGTDRSLCDTTMYEAMKNECKEKLVGPAREQCFVVAKAYHVSVKTFGKPAYSKKKDEL